MSRSNNRWQYWLFSVLSVLVLAVLVWFGLNYSSRVQAGVDAGNLPELRETLLADPASLRGNWLRTLNPLVQDVQGDLVWNAEKQVGVMRFVNLSNPKRGTFYQLWLYDARGDSHDPVSGAVFRRGSGNAEWLSLIETSTKVIDPYKFELKLERDDGKEPGQILLMVQP